MDQEVDVREQTSEHADSESNQHEADESSAKPGGLSRRQKMSAARLERRRAVDRESQRATRARTKAYITQLEHTIAAMEQNSTNGHTSTLVKQVQQKQEEIDRLTALVANVRKILNATVGNNEKTVSGDGDATETAPQLNVTEPKSHLRWPHTYDSPSEESSVDDSAALCPFTASLKCGDGPKNYFRALNTAIEFIEANGRSTVFAGQDEAIDDDITIRAVLHGWRAAEEKYDLDLAWQFIRAVDQGAYGRCHAVVRIANMRSIRSSIMHKLYGNCANRRKPAAYLAATEAQKSIKHPSLVDFFVWPQLRDYLINTRTTYTSEVESLSFAMSLRFQWPYELRDVCRRHRDSGLYSYSEAFDKSFYDLSSWTIAPEFYGVSSISALVLQPDCNLARQISAQQQARAAGAMVLRSPQDPIVPGNPDTTMSWLPTNNVNLDNNYTENPPATDYNNPDAAFISSAWPELGTIMDTQGWIT